jgi:uncharacterized protein (TIGR02145 family)
MKKTSLFAIVIIFVLSISCSNNHETETLPQTDCGTVTTTYPIVLIGSQNWMQKNLDVCSYRNGDPIPQVIDPSQWQNLTTGAWCYYNNDSSNGTIYGKLYNWYAVNDARGLAPEGYHIPTNSEWIQFENYLIANGYNFDGTKAGNKIAKSIASTNLWQTTTTGTTGAVGHNVNSNNSSGFSGIPGGFRHENGLYNAIEQSTMWWSSTQTDNENAWYRYINKTTEFLYSYSFNKQFGYSVRCIKD